MATELERRISDSQKGGADHAAVCKQLVERVKALEESVKKMGGKEAECGALCPQRPAAGKVGEPPPCCYTFQMPMHYPRYRKADYEVMPEWRLDRLLQEYGLPVNMASTLAEKREYAMGVFLWSDQRDN